MSEIRMMSFDADISISQVVRQGLQLSNYRLPTLNVRTSV